VAREGLPFIGVALGLTLTTILLGWWVPALILGLATAFTAFFFRDPERHAPDVPDAVLSPADGTILKIEHVEGTDIFPGSPALKISIFMSVFNVHVNRIPLNGVIREISYRPGKFFSADLDKASVHNESNRLIIDTLSHHRIMVVQIAGLVARRIACWVSEGTSVRAGQRFGLIRFGSRLEVYLPAAARVTITRRQKVKAGETVIAHMPAINAAP